jgi:single-strand DNA-binding protein
MNKAQIIGHVGKDPEIRTTQGGSKVASFSVATTETWKDKKTGDRKEKTEWHRVVVFSPGLVGIVEKYVKKGAKLYVEGQLATRKWTDKKGNDNYTTEIVIKSYGGTIELLDRKPTAPAEPTTAEDAPLDDTYAGELEDDVAF